MSDWRIVEGDCVAAMQVMDECSVDAVVTDPPYGLEFMGKDWDRLFRTYGPGSGRPDSPSIKERGDGWQPGSTFGGRQKQPRCMRCGKLMGRGTGVCKCPEPVPNTRHAESGYQMQFWHEAWAREALRVLKPGGHLLAFSGTRTSHRMVCAVEDAGFEIRDSISWLYGSGFPKSLDVGKAIDKAAGAEREVIGARHRNVKPYDDEAGWNANNTTGAHEYTAPATLDAEQWDGWGTALKPAHEPIVVARKPLAGTVAGNVLEHGTGGLNIDGCRVGFTSDADEAESKGKNRHADFGSGARENAVFGEDNRPRGEHGNYDPPGRWPANVILDPDAAAMLDEQTGESVSTGGRNNVRSGAGNVGEGRSVGVIPGDPGYGDSGGASRFFYVPKTSSAERNAGLDGFEERSARDTYGDGLQGPRPHTADDYEWQRKGARNSHPTVKPIELMRWLVRLVTPPGGTVLDPFAGSGTTGAAALLEGFTFVGIEREAEYAAIARARIAWWAAHPDGMELVRRLEHEREAKAKVDAGQLSLVLDGS